MARSERGDNPFDGFADWQEAQTPGYKAQCAREKAELLRQKEERRAALIVLHGSLEAVLEPCPSEVLLQAAVAPWRKTLAPPYERWTEHLDGWSNWYAPPPAHVAAAIREAYPAPENFEEARAEYEYWRQQEKDFGLIHGEFFGDRRLDLVACIRMEFVYQLLENDLIVRTPSDLFARLRFYADYGVDVGDKFNHILSDVERFVACEKQRPPTARASGPVQHGRIAAAIKADPCRPDRAIAREFGCSPTTAGKIRAELGLSKTSRSVRRGRQVYTSNYKLNGE